ncbi:MAG: thioredoxin-disulfide reductase [Oligoflexia bacterium]|nr:thioredoxin-disulfide reductase [Oligoflexia bacterium]
MNGSQHSKILILGSGPAGLTAAIYTSRANLNPVLVHGPLPGGQLTTTTEVENFPGFPEGVMGPDLMQLFEKQAARFGAKIMVDTINKVDLNTRPFKLSSDKQLYTCDALIIATGAVPKYLGLPEERELLGYGLSTCATCDGAFFRNKTIMVVGGGDSAAEEALFLTRFGSQVLLVHRRDELRASKIMRQRVVEHPKIKPLWNRAVAKIHGDKKSGVTGVTLKDTVSGKTEEVQTDGLFIAIGHTPSSQLFKGVLDMDENGYIVPKPNSTLTNIAGVFACGDVQDHVFRQAITAAGTGCMAAIEAERWLESQHA